MTVDGTELETEPAVVDDAQIERALEAILMVADEPMSLVTLATAVGAPVKRVRAAIDALVADFDGSAGPDGTPGVRRGFELREVGGGWRIYVRPEHDDAVREFVLTQNPTKLSQAALETPAVIAYKQPISRGAIASIRAVNVDSVVRTCERMKLWGEVGEEARYLVEVTALLTTLGMNFLTRGQFD